MGGNSLLTLRQYSQPAIQLDWDNNSQQLMSLLLKDLLIYKIINRSLYIQTQESLIAPELGKTPLRCMASNHY